MQQVSGLELQIVTRLGAVSLAARRSACGISLALVLAMKHAWFHRAFLLAIVTVPWLAAGCGNRDRSLPSTRTPSTQALSAQGPRAGVTSAVGLNGAVAEDLVALREEEKLARDVYFVLYETWGAAPFANIGASEQRHFDSVGMLLAEYGVEDPAVDDAGGAFTSTVFQNLYETLTDEGHVSALEAFRVGATIEELDLADIQRMSGHAPPENVRAVYDQLSCGSRNHLRAFVRHIEAQGGTFEPQHLSRSQVDAILSGAQERCGMR